MGPNVKFVSPNQSIINQCLFVDNNPSDFPSDKGCWTEPLCYKHINTKNSLDSYKQSGLAGALGATTARERTEFHVNLLRLLTTRNKQMAMVTGKPCLVDIVHVHCKCVIQKEFLSTKFTFGTNNLHIGFRIDEITSDGVFSFYMLPHLAVWRSLKSAVAPLTHCIVGLSSKTESDKQDKLDTDSSSLSPTGIEILWLASEGAALSLSGEGSGTRSLCFLFMCVFKQVLESVL